MDKIFYCEKCDYVAKYKSDYDKHLNGSKHLTGKRKERCDKQEEPFKCAVCGYESTNEFNYKSHYLNNHSTKEDKKKDFKYYCECCDFGTFVKTCYELHIKTQKHKTKSLNNIAQQKN